MRTIHLAAGDLGGFRDALRKSRDETIVVRQDGYRIVMARGEVISSSGHSEIDVTPVEMDSRRDRVRAKGRDTGHMMNEYCRDDFDTDLFRM